MRTSKKWYQSKTLGLILISVLMALAGYLSGDLTIRLAIVLILKDVVQALNRVYATTETIQTSSKE